MPKYVVSGASALFLLFSISGCSVTVTSTDTCHADSAVAGCGPGAFGYSCTGSATPNLSLNCSDPTYAGDAALYCCFTPASTTVDCKDVTVSSGCPGVGADFGFSCTGGETPDQINGSLVCGTAAPDPSGSGALLYCCNIATCASDTSLVCYGGSTGVACTGGAAPDASMNCSDPAVGPRGDTYYCCGGTVGACAQDATVTGCQAGSAGYSCTGSATPSSSDLWCSEGTVVSGEVWYCCESITSTTTTCVADSTVACPSTGSGPAPYGFACSGTDKPSDVNSALTCSDGVAGNDGNTLYCCQ
jgi:hypothetical protein